MALTRSLILTIALFSALLYTTTAQLGGLTKIEDVEHNKEVQELGNYSVEEYNKRINGRKEWEGNMFLTFVEVVSAEKQVVTGTKYYLKLEALEKGVKKLFESQVVVRPWIKNSPRTLLRFAPATEN